MKNYFWIRLLPLMLMLMLAFKVGAQTEHHRATRLGNPATRFAPPLSTPEDLRALFRNEKMWPDFATILHIWGWQGKLDDFLGAGLTNPVSEYSIPVGDTMPFMSSRLNGFPVCLRNVTWAGEEPISALAFTFTSNGRIYRCVVPKPCGNFFVEDIGPAPTFGLAIACELPQKMIAGRPAPACFNIHNTGNVTASNITVHLPVPQNSLVASTTDEGMMTNHVVVWKLASLSASATKQVCVRLKGVEPGSLVATATASSAEVSPVQTTCETTVVGLPAILLEKADDPDPVPVGTNTTYTVKVTNQGTAPDANVQVEVTVARELKPVTADGGSINGQIVTFPVVPALAPKADVTYTVVAEGVDPGIGVTKFSLKSDMLGRPIGAEESTTVY